MRCFTTQIVSSRLNRTEMILLLPTVHGGRKHVVTFRKYIVKIFGPSAQQGSSDKVSHVNLSTRETPKLTYVFWRSMKTTAELDMFGSRRV
jgi:hypothetical protein